jgi:hypothetical protein
MRMAYRDQSGERRSDCGEIDRRIDLGNRRFRLGEGGALGGDPFPARPALQDAQRLLRAIVLGQSQLVRRLRVVELLLTDGAALEQAPGALHVALRVADPLLGGAQPGAALSDLLAAEPALQLGQHSTRDRGLGLRRHPSRLQLGPV